MLMHETPCLIPLFTLFLTVVSVDNVANSLCPDQALQNVGPDLDPSCLTLIV